MTHDATSTGILQALDHETMSLVQLAAILAGGNEDDVRFGLTAAVNTINPVWVEELILQTYLFAGFPRSLNGAREWRQISGRSAPCSHNDTQFDCDRWTELGEATCATVYGRFYSQLRQNIRGLHPALDTWMITEGYGKVLSRPGLELWRRELCIIAACAISRQERQLHSHLHGALNAGATTQQVGESLDGLQHLLTPDDIARYHALWNRIQGK